MEFLGAGPHAGERPNKRPMILIEGVSPSKGLLLAVVARIHIGIDTVRKKLRLS
jgi:hypothetical protein